MNKESVLQTVIKRNGEKQDFSSEKITQAIYKAMLSVNHESRADAEKVTYTVVEKLEKSHADPLSPPDVEYIQDVVEQSLMSHGLYDVAKAYIIYRKEHADLRKRDIFSKRVALKPYEYPDLYEYVSAIRHSYWIHTEFNYTSDIQDFKVGVTDTERSAIKHAMLAIAQIEVAVKTFWGDIYKKLPKPEIGAVGFTFAESEVRHMDAYSHLLEILGLNNEFSDIKEIPALLHRVEYLEKIIKNSRSDDNKEYSQAILLFSLFIEHVSLFSQFLIIMSFNKYKNLFKGISNAVEATSKEEQIHGLFGIDVINTIHQEHPEWFNDEYKQHIIQFCKESFEAEKVVIDWILEKGELDFLPKEVIIEFVKNRFNNSLESIGIEKIFDINEDVLHHTDWFDDEVIATKHGDFFVKRSINYNKRNQSVTGNDLF